MSFFDFRQKFNLARSVLLKSNPAYVQFYITARCNLACEQCNIIYADAAAEELSIAQIEQVAQNLAEIGVCIVLLIGGEPFVRRDLPEIIRAFTSRGIHVRMQTNGLASRTMMERCLEAGGHDISISLDSLIPVTQDVINGGFRKSWDRAIDSVAMVNELFPANGTAFFGTVLMPRNLYEIPDVVEFATAIGWGVSLVPVHTTTPDRPRSFRTFDDPAVVTFSPDAYPGVARVLERLKQMRRDGYLLYDSDEYLDDVYRFIAGAPLQWRRRNHDVCDSPNLYFAIAPNGNVKACVDFELDEPFPVQHPEFPKWWRDGRVHREVYRYTRVCDGCMYGSYPEISVSLRYLKPLWQRFLYFNVSPPRLQRLTAEQMKKLAADIHARNIARRAWLRAGAGVDAL
jgi:MoaA/NifB/PqqE/SkfB family radical SAM enzyme